jgi:hypothetical protein
VVGQKPINRYRAYLFESIRPPRWEQMLNTAASFLDGPNGTNWARNPKIDNDRENREALERMEARVGIEQKAVLQRRNLLVLQVALRTQKPRCRDGKHKLAQIFRSLFDGQLVA